MSGATWAVELELFSRSSEVVVFDSIETGVRLTMSREVFENAGQPSTMTVLVAYKDLSEAAKLSDDAQPLSGEA